MLLNPKELIYKSSSRKKTGDHQINDLIHSECLQFLQGSTSNLELTGKAIPGKVTCWNYLELNLLLISNMS